MHVWNYSKYKINTFNWLNFSRKIKDFTTACGFLFHSLSECLSVSIKCWIQVKSHCTWDTHNILIFPGEHLKMQLLKFLKCLPPQIITLTLQVLSLQLHSYHISIVVVPNIATFCPLSLLVVPHIIYQRATLGCPPGCDSLGHKYRRTQVSTPQDYQQFQMLIWICAITSASSP